MIGRIVASGSLYKHGKKTLGNTFPVYIDSLLTFVRDVEKI